MKRIRQYRKLSLVKCTCISQCHEDKLERYLFLSQNEIMQSRNDIYREAETIYRKVYRKAETIYRWKETISRKATRYLAKK